MSATVTLTSEEIRQLMYPLRYESSQIQILMEDTERRRLENEQRILDVQAQCPHENVREITVQDCAEMKERTFCVDCGAQVQIRAKV